MNMRRKLSFPGLGSLLSYFPGRVTYSRMGVGIQSGDPGVWFVDLWTGRAPETWLSMGPDAFKEDEVIRG